MMRKEVKSVPQALSDDKILDVTCGNLTGKLHRELFTCPGIHRDCIELENGEFVSPKKFMFMGEKARLKDWKNAVRINGIQVRKHIDAGQLTFFNHDTMCTGRCQARAPSIKPEQLYASPAPTSFPSPVTYMTTTAENGIMQIQSVHGGERVEWNQNGYGDEDEMEDIKPDVQQLQMQMIGSLNQSSKTVLPATSPQAAVTYPDVCGETTDEDDRLLWKGIVELGLVDEFFREIKASLDILKNKMIRRMVPLEDTRRISIIVKELGLMTKLKYKLEAHQTDMERQRMKLDREMEELQRKVREYEQRKELLKRKSECFNQLLDMTKKEAVADCIQEPKRIRHDNLSHGSVSPLVMYQGQVDMSNNDSDTAESVHDGGGGEDGSSDNNSCENLSNRVVIVTKNSGDGDKNIHIEFQEVDEDVHENGSSPVTINHKSNTLNTNENASYNSPSKSRGTTELTKLRKISRSKCSAQDPE